MAPGSDPQTPSLFSATRITTLLGSVLVSLSSGTNYIYSGYAPQLGAKLHLSHTQLNVVGLAGNVGVYSSGPVWGRILDAKGSRIPLAGAFICLLFGYFGIRHIFDAGADPYLSSLSLGVLIICSFMTGLGGNAGLGAAINTTAKSFPDSARATTTGLVLSGFGLSAFYFSAIAHTAFPGDTSAFLLVLSLGTAIPMLIGLVIVRPVPLPSMKSVIGVEGGLSTGSYSRISDAARSPFLNDNDSNTPLLQAGSHHEQDPSVASTYHVPQASNAVELSPSRDSIDRRHSRASTQRRSFSSAARLLDVSPNIHGKRLWMTPDFYVIFAIMSLLSGTGIMYINNVGSISQALYAKGNPSYDEIEASRWQATQVSIISIGNCAGRILIGIISDFARIRLHLPRAYCLCIVSTLFIISQIVAINVYDVAHLWQASGLLGLAYGGLFGICPTIVIDWFGLAHLSENWGYVSFSPMVGGNLFSLMFGRNLDAHAPDDSGEQSHGLIQTRELPSTHQCFDGRDCYVSSLTITAVACMVALGLSFYAGWRDQQKTLAVTNRTNEAVWEEDEEQ
ncbi:major facilitator superfamily domain-containing protein [Hygrophoropsis aurantiaca]|uniref:Major facilitator superfamily domain-containing protein n=1 Tax=Hygrophoropsis aurantiaca TaxID=72124 RepID=A0ACB8ATY4_9AGAM|nr:major facilitator superfamily domain-containing protein [Hygrophoropsis aurantiaca]